jgi:hypothetical protein
MAERKKSGGGGSSSGDVLIFGRAPFAPPVLHGL